MPQYVGAVYLDVRFDATKATGDLTRQMSTTGAQAGTALGNSLADQLLAAGTKITRVGRQLSFGISGPLLALGVKSEQAFLGFDEQMTKVAALTGTGIDQTNAWSGQVLELATKYGIAGEEAAKALYLITSSGIKGQAAIDTLDVTLKASAVGMGDAATVAGLLTSAMNAYSAEGLTAADAADTLAGAVTESKIPADQLAGSISELLPFGHQMGISFGQIAGSMAALSLQGTGAAQAATQLRAIFAGMLDPSTAAAKGLERVGLSTEAVRQTMSTSGIPAAMEQIKNAIVSHGLESDTELANMYGNVRALTGVFGLLANENGQITRVMDNTTHAAGKLNAEWLITADTAGHKAKVASEGFHNELITLGEDIAPVVTSMLGFARSGVALLNALGPLRPVIIGIGVGLAVMGPLAYSLGAVVDVIGVGAKAFAFFGSSGAAAEASIAAGAGIAWAAELELLAATEANAEAQANLVVWSDMAGGSIVLGAEAAATAEWNLFLAANAVAVAEEGAAAAGANAALSMAAAFAPVLVVVAAAAAALYLLNAGNSAIKDNVDGLTDSYNNAIAGQDLLTQKRQVAASKAEAARLRKLADDYSVLSPFDALRVKERDAYKQQAAALEHSTKATEDNIGAAERIGLATGENTTKLAQWLASEVIAGQTYTTDKEKLEAYRKAMAEHGVVVSTAATATGKLSDKAKDLASAYFGVQSATRSYEDSLTKIADTERGVDDATRAVADAHQAEADAATKVTDAQDAQRDAIAKVAEARDKQRDAIAGVTAAQLKLTDAAKTYDDLLRGPSRDEKLDVRTAELALKRAQAAVKDAKDPLSREGAAIGLERAKIALEEAKGAHAKNLAKAQGDVSTATKDVTAAQKNATAAGKDVTAAEKGVAAAATAVVKAQRDVEDAHRKVDEAVRAASKATLDNKRAQEDSVGAADALAGKQDALADALKKSATGAQPLVAYMSSLKDLYPESADGIQVIIDKATALQQFIDAQKNKPPEAKVFGPAPREARASGGPLAAGQLSTVNERGVPELWTQDGKSYLLPLNAGRVVPLTASSVPAGGDGVTVGDIIVYDRSGRPRETAYELRRSFRKEAFLAGRRS